jgi:hypothetical protein
MARAACLHVDIQALALTIVHVRPFVAELLRRDAVLLVMVINQILALLAHPSGEGNQPHPKGIQGLTRWLWLPLRCASRQGKPSVKRSI